MGLDFLNRKNRFSSLLVGLLIGFPSLSVFADPASFENALKSFHKQEYDETIIHLKNSLKNNLSHIPSRLLLAETLIAQGKGATAEIELDDLQAEGVDVNQLVTLQAQALLLQNKNARVIDEITAGYRGDAVESKIQLYRGRAYLAKNQLRDAETAFINALNLNPNMQLAQLGRAQIAINKNQLDRAMEFVDKALSELEPLVNAWVMKANIANLQANYPMALASIEKALEISPDHIQAKLYRASIYIGQQTPLLAKDDLDAILLEIPLEPRAKYLRAIVSIAEGDKESAEEKLIEVVETLNAISPKLMAENPSYYYLAGLTNFELGGYDEAEQYVRNFLQVKEFDLNALRLMAMIELNLGNFNHAKKHLSKANVYFPNNLSVLTLLGITSMKLNDFANAQRYFESVISLKPDLKSDALENLARSKMAAGNYQEAIAHLLKLNTGESGDEVTLLLVESYLKSKQFEKAKSLTLALVTKYPENAFIIKKHAVALGLNGEQKEARTFFAKALALNENDIDAAIHISRMDVIEGQPEIALQRITTLLEQNKESLLLLHELAGIHTRLGNNSEAHVWYEKAFAFHRNNQVALSKLINSFLVMNQQDKATEALKSFISNNKNIAEPRLILGQLYLSQNQPQEAIKLFERSIKSELEKSRVYMLLAKAYLVIDDRDAAVLALTKAIAWNDDRIDAMEMLFNLSLKLNNIETAEKMVSNIREKLPEEPLADNMAGDLAMHNLAFEKAEKRYKSANLLKLNKKSVFGLYSAFIKQRKYYSARGILTKWLKLNPTDVLADIGIAESYHIENNYVKSISVYSKLLEKYKRMPIILNNLAGLFYQQGDTQKALDLAAEAYKKSPKVVSVIDTYAWILSQEGRYEEALPLFREALVIDFKNAEVKYHLAMTLDKENRRTEAKKLLIEAVQSDIEFTEKAAAKNLLEQWLAK